MRRFLGILTIFLGLYFGIFLCAAFYTDMSELRKKYAQVIYHGKNAPAEVKIVPRMPQGWVPLVRISKIAVAAIVMSEDDAFYQHNGLDFNQIKEAIDQDLEEGRYARGASTISQQVVKNVYLSAEKSLWRKAKELVLTLRMERQVSKHKILETYLNIAEFGEGLYGIGPASYFYFQKPPSELSAKEGAFLAMLLPSPKRYSVSYRKHELTPYARSIVNTLLDHLHLVHRLSDEEYAAELAKPLGFEFPSQVSNEQTIQGL